MVASSTQTIQIENNFTGSLLQLASTGIMSINSNAQKPGGGTWVDSSDARIKNITGDYKSGLDEILKLKPRTFTYKGNDTSQPPTSAPVGLEAEGDKTAPTVPYVNSPHAAAAKAGQEFIGLIAQEAQTVMPEMITEEAGYIDGVQVDDLLRLDPNALVYALINAVQTLTARIEALEAA